MGDTAYQMFFQATVITKLLYASSAWWGFATSDDRQHIEDFIRRSFRAGLRSPDQPPASELVADGDDKLFYCMLYNNNHVLHYLLPDRCDTSTYTLRKRPHRTTVFYLTKLGICQNVRFNPDALQTPQTYKY